MEATGVYWKPVWHILSDGEFELVLANAAHVKNVPGRKTDVNDATWLADLMAHGMIKASFVPDEPTQQMRDLLRTRKQIVRKRSSHIQRIQKTLEDANIKLDSVVTNILGLSGRRIVEALIVGQTVPQALATLAHRSINAASNELEASLHGRVTRHHRFLLKLHLDQIDAFDATFDKEVDGNLEPFRIASTIPALAFSPRREESRLRHRCIDSHCCLPNAQKRNPLPGSRRKLLRQPRQRQTSTAPDQPQEKPRIRSADRSQGGIIRK
jgi:transposase